MLLKIHLKYINYSLGCKQCKFKIIILKKRRTLLLTKKILFRCCEGNKKNNC